LKARRAVVAEAFAETQRAKILGFMMTGGGFGTLFGAAIYGWVGNYGLKLDFPLITVVEGAPYAWRTVFFMGIFPALLLAFIRRGMVEPERFAAVKARRQALATTRERTEEDRQFLAFVPRSAAVSASRPWSACCSRSARCWRCGPPRPGCRRPPLD
jgi:hypothetical protein